ncbi:MAG: ABC transporter substrate-binding protein [Pseudolabrys sp.]
MRRREFISLLGGAAAAWPLAANAQTEAKIYRIGILETVAPALNAANLDALRQGLRELGYVEKHNYILEYRSADGDAGRFPELASELVRLRVDLIVTRGTPAAQAAKTATETLPIVMAAIGEPLGAGVVASLARPGGNVTGMSAFVTELSGKRIELMKEIIPSISHVAFLQNMANPISPPQWETVKTVAGILSLSVELFDVRSEQDIVRAFAAASENKVDAVSVGIDGLIQTKADMIVELAARYKLLTAYPSREFVEAGGLLSYGVSYPDLYRRSATLIDKIFKGTKPGDLPVEQPTKLELVINLQSAKALGLSIAPTLIARADEVIE